MTVGQTLFLILFAAIGLLLVGGQLAAYGPAGITASEVIFIGLPVVLAASRRGGLAGIGFVRPRLGALAGGALVGASGWAFLGTVILPIQEHFLPTPTALEERMQQNLAPSFVGLVAIAVVPAICEELLLRGALAFALERRLGSRAVAVAGSALAFAILHGSPYRFVPTFLLGLSFGAIALRARSIVPTMLAHALNNGAVWLFSVVPSLQPLLQANAAAVLTVAVTLLALGHSLVFLPFRTTQ